MTTTIMKDSIVGDNWIRQSVAANPMASITDPKTGQPSDNLTTGPVRLNFTDTLLEPAAKPGQAPKYGCAIMFTPQADLTLLTQKVQEQLQRSFAQSFNPHTGQYAGVFTPFHDQAEKAHQYSGFTPGSVYLNASSKFKPAIVDVRGNVITDPSRIYPGVWAIVGVNAYTYGISPPQPKKGVGVGIQGIMIIGDDTRLLGGGPDTSTMFSKVKVDAPIARPGLMPGVSMGQPMMGQPAPIPQTHYQPPMQQGFQMPGAQHLPQQLGGAQPGAFSMTTSPSDDDDAEFMRSLGR